MATLHTWVKIQYMPVHVEQADNGTLIVSGTDTAIESADDQAQYGCWFCDTVLDTDTFHTECKGAPDDDDA